MSDRHPVISLYYGRACPTEASVLEALKSSAEREHDERAFLTIAGLASFAEHRRVVFDVLLAQADSSAQRGMRLAWAFGVRAARWLNPESGWFAQLEQQVPTWTADLLAPQPDGRSAWEMLLWRLFGARCDLEEGTDGNAWLAHLASFLEQRESARFQEPHPVVQGVSNAQVWAWLWASIPMREARLGHWGYLLASGIDPDFQMEVTGGRISLGTCLLWAMHTEKTLPVPSSWEELKFLEPIPPSDASWLAAPAREECFLHGYCWQAMWMLKTAGMNPKALVEPTHWGTPSLGLLARQGMDKGEWDQEDFETAMDRWLALGLDFGQTSTSGQTLLDIAQGRSALAVAKHPPLHPMPYWKVAPDSWTRAATPAAMERFLMSTMVVKLMQEEPALALRLLRLAVDRFGELRVSGLGAAEVNASCLGVVADGLVQLKGLLLDIETQHPVTRLAGLVEEALAEGKVETLLHVVLRLAQVPEVEPGTEVQPLEKMVERASFQALLASLRGHQPVSETVPPAILVKLSAWAQRQPGAPPAKNETLSDKEQVESDGTLKALREWGGVALAAAIAAGMSHSSLEKIRFLTNESAWLKSPSVIEKGSLTEALSFCLISKAALVANSPRLMNRLLTRLGQAGWASEGFSLSEVQRMQEAAEQFESLDVLTAGEQIVFEGLKQAPIECLVFLALHLSKTQWLNSAKPDAQGIADLEMLIFQCRTRPYYSKHVNAGAKRAVLAWLERAMPSPWAKKTRDERWIHKIKAEDSPLDKRPLVPLYTEASLKELEQWAATRMAHEVVQTWRGELIDADPKKSVDLESLPRQRQRLRRLAMAKPALEAMADLRAGFPHFEDVIGQIHDHLLLASRGDGSFSLPPLLMAGPPGTGKTFFFQELASKIATTYKLVSMENVEAGWAIVGLETAYGSAAPGLVFDTLIRQGATANPIILLDEIDKANGSRNMPVAPVLLSLLEPHSARRFTDRCVPLPVDASRVNWVATANDLSKVDAPLKSRFNIVHVANPDYHARRAMGQHIYRALCKSNSWGASFDPELSEETLQVLARPANAARDLRKNITQGLAAAARSSRGQVLPQDLPPDRTPRPLSPWDMPLAEMPVPPSTQVAFQAEVAP